MQIRLYGEMAKKGAKGPNKTLNGVTEAYAKAFVKG